MAATFLTAALFWSLRKLLARTVFLTDLYVARAFFLITTEVVALAGLLAFLRPVVARTIPPSALAETATFPGLTRVLYLSDFLPFKWPGSLVQVVPAFLIS